MKPIIEPSSLPRSHDGLLRTKEVCEQTGLTPRQLRWWTDKGYISEEPTPHRSGYARLWKPSVVDEIQDIQRASGSLPLRSLTGQSTLPTLKPRR